mmetsp:Transcript_46761/g.138146  ORF Transcript_46761/g.138146 Transcript_46761/m.138146 type:complete len:284 (-) Transcript_46761:125-976(-)
MLQQSQDHLRAACRGLRRRRRLAKPGRAAGLRAGLRGLLERQNRRCARRPRPGNRLPQHRRVRRRRRDRRLPERRGVQQLYLDPCPGRELLGVPIAVLGADQPAEHPLGRRRRLLVPQPGLQGEELERGGAAVHRNLAERSQVRAVRLGRGLRRPSEHHAVPGLHAPGGQLPRPVCLQVWQDHRRGERQILRQGLRGHAGGQHSERGGLLLPSSRRKASKLHGKVRKERDCGPGEDGAEVPVRLRLLGHLMGSQTAEIASCRYLRLRLLGHLMGSQRMRPHCR